MGCWKILHWCAVYIEPVSTLTHPDHVAGYLRDFGLLTGNVQDVNVTMLAYVFRKKLPPVGFDLMITGSSVKCLCYWHDVR